VNNLGREAVPGVADFLHPLGYSAIGRTASSTRRDNARGRSDSLADKTDRFGEQCGWLRDPECGQPKGKR
jgi:hypothetical protein